MYHVDILSNLAFDLQHFTREIEPDWLNRKAPYAPIRVSYHPEQFTLEYIKKRVLYLQDAGFRIGIYGVLHPCQEEEILRAQQICLDQGIDFRTKPFLGKYQGQWYGQYAYTNACDAEEPRICECAGSELLLAPDGTIHRCHHFLYSKLTPIGNVDEDHIARSDVYRPCSQYGYCNPCDIKIKNNRFQQFGHVAVKIRNIQPIPQPVS
jgi:hypothetical protein